MEINFTHVRVLKVILFKCVYIFWKYFRTCNKTFNTKYLCIWFWNIWTCCFSLKLQQRFRLFRRFKVKLLHSLQSLLNTFLFPSCIIEKINVELLRGRGKESGENKGTVLISPAIRFNIWHNGLRILCGSSAHKHSTTSYTISNTLSPPTRVC